MVNWSDRGEAREDITEAYMSEDLKAGLIFIMRLRERMSEAIHAIGDPEVEALVQIRVGLHLTAFSTLGHLGEQRGASREQVKAKLDYGFTRVGEWLAKQAPEGGE